MPTSNMSAHNGSNHGNVKEATLSFQLVIVTEGGAKTAHSQKKRFEDVSIEVTSDGKEFYVGSNYKVKWKHVSRLSWRDDGLVVHCFSHHQSKNEDALHSSRLVLGPPAPRMGGNGEEEEEEGRSFEIFGPIHRRGSPRWESFRNVLQDRFQKQERKRQRRLEEDRAQEQKKKTGGRYSGSGRTGRTQKTYSTRPLDFMKKNAANIAFNASSPSTTKIDFDSDGDDQVFRRYLSKKERGTSPDKRKRRRLMEEEDELWKNQVRDEVEEASEEGAFQQGGEGNDGSASEFDHMDDGDISNTVVVDIGSNRDDPGQGYAATDESVGNDAGVSEDELPTIARTKNRVRRFRKRTPILEEDSDDDDAFFHGEGPALTTPAAQRVVSPGTTGGNKFHEPTVGRDEEGNQMTLDTQADEKVGMGVETDSDATPALESEAHPAVPENGRSIKVRENELKAQQSIASFFKPFRSASNVDDALTGPKLTANKINTSTSTSKGTIEIIKGDEAREDFEHSHVTKTNVGIDKCVDDGNETLAESLDDSSTPDESQEAAAARSSGDSKMSVTAAEKFFSPQPKHSTQKTKKFKSLSSNETDGDSTVVATSTPGSISHCTDVIETDDDEKVDRKSQQSNGDLNSANLSTPTRHPPIKYEIVRKSAKNIEDEDPIDEIGSSQSPPHKSSSSRKSRKLASQPRRRLKNAFGSSRNAFHALDFADAKSQFHGSPQFIATEASSAFKTPKKQSPLVSTLTGSSTGKLDGVSSSPHAALQTQFKWRGLRNNGNSCYVNASLQMLFSLPQFMSAIGELQEGHRLVKSLSRLWDDLAASGRTGAATARGLKDAMDDLTDRFRGFQQRDAHEFLGELIDRVHDELLDTESDSADLVFPSEVLQGVSKKANDVVRSTSTTKAREPTDDFFRLDVQVCLECKSCGYSRSKEEMYRYLSIDIDSWDFDPQNPDASKPSVDRCLKHFFSPEDREIKCEKCEEGRIATQTMNILSQPKALLLHLKRFVMVELESVDEGNNASGLGSGAEMTFRKNKARVELNKQLSLGKFLAQKDEDSSGLAIQSPSKNYTLKSIVHHIGNTAVSGHYTADALRHDTETDTSQWVSYDDGSTEETTEDMLLQDGRNQRTAYMLLYAAV